MKNYTTVYIVICPTHIGMAHVILAIPLQSDNVRL